MDVGRLWTCPFPVGASVSSQYRKRVGRLGPFPAHSPELLNWQKHLPHGSSSGLTLMISSGSHQSEPQSPPRVGLTPSCPWPTERARWSPRGPGCRPVCLVTLAALWADFFHVLVHDKCTTDVFSWGQERIFHCSWQCVLRSVTRAQRAEGASGMWVPLPNTGRAFWPSCPQLLPGQQAESRCQPALGLILHLLPFPSQLQGHFQGEWGDWKVNASLCPSASSLEPGDQTTTRPCAGMTWGCKHPGHDFESLGSKIATASLKALLGTLVKDS